MFFSKAGEYPPCGMFNFKHLILFILTMFFIMIGVKYTKVKEKSDVTKIIKVITVIVWILEILKIFFNIMSGYGLNYNKIIPLYYCSLLLYSGILSIMGKGIIARIGNVFLATGGIIGGLVFLIMPSTSLPEYPIFHVMTFHSFLYHGIMIYLGIIINKFKYIELKISDLKYYSILIFVVCICAYIVNSILGSNLMFISQDFPGMPLSNLYHATVKMFPIIMSLVQMTLPFLVVYGVIHIKNIYEEHYTNLKFIKRHNKEGEF